MLSSRILFQSRTARDRRTSFFLWILMSYAIFPVVALSSIFFLAGPVYSQPRLIDTVQCREVTHPVNAGESASPQRAYFDYWVEGSDRIPSLVYRGDEVLAALDQAISRQPTILGTLVSAWRRNELYDELSLTFVLPTIHLNDGQQSASFSTQLILTRRKSTDAGVMYVVGPVEINEIKTMACVGKYLHR